MSDRELFRPALRARRPGSGAGASGWPGEPQALAEPETRREWRPNVTVTRSPRVTVTVTVTARSLARGPESGLAASAAA